MNIYIDIHSEVEALQGVLGSGENPGGSLP